MSGRAEAARSRRLIPRPGSLFAFLASRCASSLAFQIQAVAIGWQAYASTRQPLTLGLIGLAQFLPMPLLVFASGHVADRFDRRRVAMLCQAVEACCALALAWGTWSHSLTPVMLYLAVAVVGAAKAFEGPSLQALLPSLVPAGRFSRAAALGASLQQAATIAGPSIGGLLVLGGAGFAYAGCAALFVIALAMIALARPRRVADDDPSFEPLPAGPRLHDGVFGGLAFIRSQPMILGAISLDLFAVLLGGATAMLPVYALDILHGSPLELGLLRAAPAIGALSMSLLLARRPIGGRAGRTMFAAVMLFGVATIVFGLSRSLPLSIAALAVLGAADVVSVVVRSTLVQLRTPDAMRGRVSAVNTLFIVTSNQLGEFESGGLAWLLGSAPASVVAGGIGTLLVAALWMRLFPGLAELDRLDATARQ